MEVSQIYSLVNTVTTEVLGSAILTQEDLGDVVDVGTQIFNSGAIDNYVKSLVNHIGRVVFVNRPYEGSAPSVLMDAWEYGSVMEKITAALPAATENQSWELQDGQTYDPNVFTKPNVSAKFFNSRTTFEIPMSFTERQVKESFSNAQQLNAFISMIETAIYKSLTVKTDALVMRTINNMIANTIVTDFAPNGAGYDEGSGTKAVNLLYLYNQMYPDATITDASVAIKTSRFIRFAAYTMKLYAERMKKVSTLFNIGATDKFTPESLLHIVLLSDFAAAADVYEQSDTFHDTFTALPTAERVPFWQGSGTDYSFNSVSSINVTTSNGNETGVDLVANGILGVMFDRDALGVCNWDRRVTTNYNPRAEFYNNWYKQDAMYFNDFNENFVVFYAAASE